MSAGCSGPVSRTNILIFQDSKNKTLSIFATFTTTIKADKVFLRWLTMIKKQQIFLLLFVSIILSTYGQEDFSSLTIKLNPVIDIPVSTSTDYYTTGGSGFLSLSYKPPISFPLYVNTVFGYDYIPFVTSDISHLNIVMAGAGIGLQTRLLGRISAEVFVNGGYFMGFLEDNEGNMVTGGNPFWDTGGEVGFYINPQLSVGIGSYYRNYMGLDQSFMDTVGIYFSTSYRFPISGNMNLEPANSQPSNFRPSLLKISSIKTDGIFPVFYQYYDEHPIGKIEVKNNEKSSIEDLKVTVFIHEYMDIPKIYNFPGSIKRGEIQIIDLYALFNKKVLEITEGTKVAAEIKLNYTIKGEPRQKNRTETLKLENRNASIWDDDRRAAAFVTAKDPSILRFSKNLISLIRETGSQSIDSNLRTAIAIHEALSVYGLTYVIDPNTPYEDFVLNKQAIDFLQFPRQTLEYKAGDCDDLSILYSALLESVSIETAFITVPGHIYIAFALKMSPDNARSFFANSDDLIYKNDKAWLPVEVTMVQKNFREAWSIGAKEWRKYEGTDKAGFYPVKEAWNIFAPVGLPGDNQNISIIKETEVVEIYNKELTNLVKREINQQEKDLIERISASNNNPRMVNKLGILYARYGIIEKAEAQFLKASSNQSYAPSLMNLGNIYYMKNEMSKALEYYKKADQKTPGNPSVLLGLARVSYALDDYESAEENYNQLEIVAPEIAGKFAYLTTQYDTSARAAEADRMEEMLWED